MLALCLLLQAIAFAQPTGDLAAFKAYAETDAAPAELNAQRARTAEMNIDLLGLAKSPTLQLDLFNDISYRVAFDRLDRRHPVGDVDVYWGNSGDPAWAHLPHYNDVILTVNRTTGKAIIYAMTSDGMFVVTPSVEKNRYLIYQTTDIDWANAGCEDLTKTVSPVSDGKSLMMVGCEEQDADGNFVVDMFFSYSLEAELAIGDVVAHSIAQAESVNIGLANSEVTNTYLRVIDIAVGDNFVGVYSPALNPNLDFYEDQMEAVGADMIADYQTANPEVENAGGWAFVPGRTSINSITAPNAFRHEWGHNSGSNHCTPGVLPYSSGFDNGNGSNKTHLCGNNINFFSNPRIDDANGVPIGDAATADNARAIMEARGRVMSGYRTHLVPFSAADNGNCPSPIADGAYYLQNVASRNYLSPDNVGNVGEMVGQSLTNTDNEDIWEIHNLGNGQVSIYNRNRNTTLDRFSSSNAVGNNVGVWSHNNLQSNQTWSISEAPSGNYVITSSTSANVLRIANGAAGAGDPVGQGLNNATDSVEWLFLPATVSPAVVSIDLAGNSTSCTSSQDGELISTITGGTAPYTYEWNNGSDNADLAEVLPGAYVVTVTSGGRRYFKTGSIRTTAPLIAEVETTRATTLAGGEINITNVINATGNLSYTWSDGGPDSPNRTNVPAGDYSVTITDGNGCQEIRLMRVVKTIAAAPYLIQHVASGLYLEHESGQVLLGDCPTDAEQYRWTAVDEGGSIVKFRNNNGLMLTVFGRTQSGAEYWTGGDGNVSPHKHDLIPTGTDTWIMRNQFQGFYTGTTGDAIGSILIHEELADATSADEFRFIPIVDCNPASGTACVDNPAEPVNLICECCGQETLPVSLTTFSGEALPKINRLYWTTASETENAGFLLERSAEGQNFLTLTWIPGNGTTSQETHYRFDDDAPLAGTSYYRLRQTDLDGTESLSQVVALTRTDGTEWTVFPNPVTGREELNIQSAAGNASFVLYDMEGRQLTSIKQTEGGGLLRLSLAGLPKGVYVLHNEADGSTRRVVKTK